MSRLVLPSAVLEDSFGQLHRCGKGRAECVLYWCASLDRPDRLTRAVHPVHEAGYAWYEVDSAWVTGFFLDLRRRRERALSDICQALARTALLIDLDIFGPGADHHRIIDGLRGTTARIITDRANIASPAGQTALVTLYAQLAMMGLQIDLDIPGISLLVPQPPLRGTDLPASLLDYADDLLPGGSARPAATLT